MSESSVPRIIQGCKYHPPLPAKVHCRECNAPLCSICSKFVDGKFLCEECIAANVARKVSLSATVASGSFRPGSITRNATRAIPPEAYLNAPVAVAVPPAPEVEAAPAYAAAQGVPAMPFTPGMPTLPGKPPSGSVPLGSVRFDRQVAAAHPATGMPNVVPGQKTTFIRSGPDVQERLSQHRKEVSSRKYSCKNHPGIEAQLKCDLCGGVFCADCVKETRKKMLCRDCARPGGRASLIARPAEATVPLTFSNRLPGAFLSPLLAERKYLLLLAPPALWMGFSLHWAAGLAASAYIALWLMKITRRTAQNVEDRSSHPTLEDSANDFVKPFFMGMLAVIVLLLPILIYVPLGRPDILRKGVDFIGLGTGTPDVNGYDSDRALSYITSHAAADRFISWALLAAAAILPLCLGMLGLFGRSDVLSPPTLATALSRIGVYYALILILLAAAFIPTWYVVGVLKEFSGLLGLLCGFLITYFSMVSFRIFGDVYLTNKGLFEFYGRPLAES